MKPLIPIVTAVTLSLIGVARVSGQEPSPSGGPIAQAQAAADRAAFEKAQAQADKAHDETEEMAEGDKAKQMFNWNKDKGAGRVRTATAAPGVPSPLMARGPAMRAPAASKSFVIRSSNVDSKEQTNLEEDLTVMSHLLEKSLEDLPGGHRHRETALGIDLFFAPGSSPMRSLYLDGYGAVFLLNVSFPLVPPPHKVEMDKPATNSDWEAARDEVYGQRGEGRFTVGALE